MQNFSCNAEQSWFLFWWKLNKLHSFELKHISSEAENTEARWEILSEVIKTCYYYSYMTHKKYK